MITVRPATTADADLLLSWANDPVTRAAGFHAALIEPEVHRRWLHERLASSTGRLYIGQDDDRPIGQVRLDAFSDGRVEVGISVAPGERGRGLGRDLLRAGMAAGIADPQLRVLVYVARIRPDNEASIALFSGAGFLHVGSEDVHGQRALIYELPAP